MSVVHVTGTGGGVVPERPLFVGTKIPEEIVRMIQILSTGCMDKPTFRAIVAGIVAVLEGKSTDSSAFDKLVKPEAGLSSDVILIVASGLHCLLQRALQFSDTALKSEMLKEDLVELKFPKEHIADIVSVVYGSRRVSLQKCASDSKPQLPTLEEFKWRVDVGISTSVLSRALEPTVMMQMSLSDGATHNFEACVYTNLSIYYGVQVSVSKFHELRYNVASVLKEIEELEKRTTKIPS